MPEIRVAIVGVGNCASALIQGLEYYRSHSVRPVGLIAEELGGYRLTDIHIVAAFDVDERKVGKDLSEAVPAQPNCNVPLCEALPRQEVVVQMGNVMDGVAEHMSEYPPERSFRIARAGASDITKVLQDSDAEVLINYLPVGAEEASRFYAHRALEAGCGMVNCIPVFIASDEGWAGRFTEAKLPIVGDDIKSQLGATIVHRVLAKLLDDRGVKLDRTYQLNVGGNTDFLNMLDRKRLISKKISKTESVQSQLGVPLEANNIHIGPSDYVPWLYDNKVCFIRMEGRGFAQAPIVLDLKLSVQDSPNSAGIVVDAIRCCKVALDRKTGGPLLAVSAYAMKHPPQQMTDPEARVKLMAFASGKG